MHDTREDDILSSFPVPKTRAANLPRHTQTQLLYRQSYDFKDARTHLHPSKHRVPARAVGYAAGKLARPAHQRVPRRIGTRQVSKRAVVRARGVLRLAAGRAVPGIVGHQRALVKIHRPHKGYVQGPARHPPIPRRWQRRYENLLAPRLVERCMI